MVEVDPMKMQYKPIDIVGLYKTIMAQLKLMKLENAMWFGTANHVTQLEED